MNHSLEYYRVFYYVSKLGSVTKASEVLHISQPAVSRSIAELEGSLKTVLFNRKPRGMALTNEGKLLFSHVEPAFESLLTAEHELVQYKKHMEGTIRIAATETALYHFLLDKLESFKVINPQISFHIVGGNSTVDTIAMLREGRADITLAVSLLKNQSDLTVLSVKTFRDIFVVSPSFFSSENFRQGNWDMTALEIIGYPIIAVEKGNNARSLIDLWFSQQGILLKPAITVRTSTMVLPFVKRNMGIGILPEPFVQKAISKGKMVEIKVKKPLYSRDILVIHLGMSPLVNKFLRHLLGNL